ncbi:EAL domain-containing protein [Selenomonas sp. GACV-9]|uniref:EAL domain-containing protein n=1 Tax=Selenomonas sp. GACV-9 TaxID=3158782 RepID=UPI0015A57B8B
MIMMTAAASLLAMLPTASAHERQLLRVGYTDKPGYLVFDANHYYHGMLYESIESIATYLGANIIYVPGSLEENRQRLQSGDIDIIASSDSISGYTVPDAILLSPPDSKTIPLARGIGWLEVNTNNPALIGSIESSLKELRSVAPLHMLHLLEKYHEQDRSSLNLTPEEKQYLAEHPVIKAMASPGQPPYTYFTDSGTHTGVVADIMALIAADLDIRIEVIPNQAQADMLQQLADGQITLITDFYADYNWARQHNADLTLPYLTLNYVTVMRKDQPLPDTPIIACPRSHFYVHEYIEKMFPPEQLVYYDTVQECMAAVNNRQADMTFVKSITAQSDIHLGNYYNLYTNSNVVFSHEVAMAVSSQADPLLVRILNKEIAHIGQQQIASIVNRQVYTVQSQDTLSALIYRNPISALLYCTSVLVTIILALLFLMRLNRRHNEALYREAHYIKEVDMYNLRWFVKKLPENLERYQAERAQGKMFLLVLSAQHISFLRELYSRKTFNQALVGLIEKARTANDWLLSHAMSSDTIAIAVLCRLPEGFTMEQAATKLTQDASSCIVNGTPMKILYHVGLCAIPPEGPIDAANLLNNAMLAYAESVSHNRDISIYNADLRQHLLYQKQMESLMDKALKNGEFKIYLQPKYNLKTQTIIAAEALVRWQSPELGFLLPNRFIDLFERNGFAIALDYYMLETVCRYQRERIDQGLPVIPISVNQSGLHITEENYLKRMKAIAQKYQLPPDTIELEITETAFIDYNSHDAHYNAAAIVSQLRHLGFRLSMDDFCTGYSSIAMLQHLPMDVMKIDRSMLLAAEKSPRALTILQHIVDLGQSLNMDVLTEGIETRQQELLLLSIGCHLGQGFLFSRPMPLEEFAAFVEEHSIES